MEPTIAIRAAAASGQSSSPIDGVIIALDLIYAGVYLAFAALRVGYIYYFRIIRSSWPRTPILRYWLALAVFILMVACGYIFVGAFWVYKDTMSFLADRVSKSALRAVLFVPLYLALIAGGWLLVGAYSQIKKRTDRSQRRSASALRD